MGSTGSRALWQISYIVVTLIVALAMLEVQPASGVGPVILTVDTVVDDPSLDSCLDAIDDDSCSLRGAIDYANATGGTDGYHIDIPVGNYFLNVETVPANEDSNQEGDLDISASPVTLDGASMLLTVLNGNGTDRVIDHVAASGILTMTTLTVTNGALLGDEGGGGGIRVAAGNTLNTLYVRITQNLVNGTSLSYDSGGGVFGYNGATLNLIHTAIQDNQACTGAGISSWNGGLLLQYSEVRDNTITLDCQYSGYGGGLNVIDVNGTDAIHNTLFDGNEAYVGAGLFGGSEVFEIRDSTFSHNTAAFRGGGLTLFGSPELKSVTVNNNSAADGGGGLWVRGAVDLYNVTIAGNYASWGGGVLIFSGEGSELSMDHVSFAANTSAEGHGYAICANSGSIVSVHNSILASPSATGTCYLGLPLTWTSLGYNISNDSSCLLGVNDWVNTNPMLGILGDYGGYTETLPLLNGSPAIDTGDPADPANRLDQRGMGIRGDHSDRGAFEYPPFLVWLASILK